MKEYIYDDHFSKQYFVRVEVDSINAGKCPVCTDGVLDLRRHPVLHSEIPEKFNIACSKCGRFFERPAS